MFIRAARGLRRHSLPLSLPRYTGKVKPRKIAVDALHSRGWLKAFTARGCRSLFPITKVLLLDGLAPGITVFCMPNHGPNGRYSTEVKSLLITRSSSVVNPTVHPLRNRQPRTIWNRMQILYSCTTSARRDIYR